MDVERRYINAMNAIVDLYQDEEISIFDTIKSLTVLQGEITVLIDSLRDEMEYENDR